MRIYEELFILRPDAPEEEIDHLIEQLTTYIASQGGNVDKSDKWGIRKLAYRVQKRNEGFYVLLQFTTKPETVLEVERRLRVSDLVMKFQSVRIDEKLKEDREAQKGARKARRSQTGAAGCAQRADRACDGWRGRTGWPKTGSSDAWRASARADGKGGRITWPNNEADVPLADRCDPPAATKRWPPRSNISGARKFADSAWKRSTTSTTRTCECSRPSFPSAGKIVPRRISGVCTPHQKRLAEAIKQARNIALIPFASAI